MTSHRRRNTMSYASAICMCTLVVCAQGSIASRNQDLGSQDFPLQGIPLDTFSDNAIRHRSTERLFKQNAIMISRTTENLMLHLVESLTHKIFISQVPGKVIIEKERDEEFGVSSPYVHQGHFVNWLNAVMSVWSNSVVGVFEGFPAITKWTYANTLAKSMSTLQMLQQEASMGNYGLGYATSTGGGFGYGWQLLCGNVTILTIGGGLGSGIELHHCNPTCSEGNFESGGGGGMESSCKYCSVHHGETFHAGGGAGCTRYYNKYKTDGGCHRVPDEESLIHSMKELSKDLSCYIDKCTKHTMLHVEGGIGGGLGVTERNRHKKSPKPYSIGFGMSFKYKADLVGQNHLSLERVDEEASASGIARCFLNKAHLYQNASQYGKEWFSDCFNLNPTRYNSSDSM